jgi:hypothetical protein
MNWHWLVNYSVSFTAGCCRCHGTVHVSFLFDKAAVLDVMIKERLCTVGGGGDGHFYVSISL